MVFKLFSECGCELGEGPVWSNLHSALFWLDITAMTLYCKKWAGSQSCWNLDEICSAMAVIDKDRLLIAGASGIHVSTLRPALLN